MTHTRPLIFLLFAPFLLTVLGSIASQNSPQKPVILLVGNPGTGKSYLGNALCGRQAFVSERILTAVTSAMQTCETELFTVVDVPGLMDTQNLERNKREIKNALTLGRNYVVVYMLTLRFGRVLSQDIEALRAILDSASLSPDQLGLIINGEILNQTQLAEIIMLYREELGFPFRAAATYIGVNEGQDTFLPRVHRMLNQLDPTFIRKDSVKDINLTADLLRQQLAASDARFEELKSSVERIKKENQQEIQRLQDELQRQRESKRKGFLDKLLSVLEDVATEVLKKIPPVIIQGL